MKKIALATILILTSSFAFAGNDPCGIQKIGADHTGHQEVINCYIDQAVGAYMAQRKQIQAETPADKAGSDARWSAMEAIDKAVAELESKKIPEGKFADVRKDNPASGDKVASSD